MGKNITKVTLGYAIPVLNSSRCDDSFIALDKWVCGHSSQVAGLFFSGTIRIGVLYIVRFMAVGYNPVEQAFKIGIMSMKRSYWV